MKPEAKKQSGEQHAPVSRQHLRLASYAACTCNGCNTRSGTMTVSAWRGQSTLGGRCATQMTRVTACKVVGAALERRTAPAHKRKEKT